MLLIPDDSTLRTFVPNTFQTLEGESTLFDKVRPSLVTAEIRFETELVPKPILERIVNDTTNPDDELYFLPRRLVSLWAWASALPSTDVVVTANGLGAVETNTLKPASKAKVDRLVDSLRASADETLLQLLPLLPQVSGWLRTEQARRLRRTLFSGVDHLGVFGITRDLWEQRNALSPLLQSIEDMISDEWVSADVMRMLRHEAQAGRLCDTHQVAAALLRSAVIKLALPHVRTGGKVVSVPRSLRPSDIHWADVPEVEQVTDMIRRDPGEFPGFQGSRAQQRLDGPVYKNRRDSGAYYF